MSLLLWVGAFGALGLGIYLLYALLFAERMP